MFKINKKTKRQKMQNTQKFKFAVYRLVIMKHCEYHSFIGFTEAADRNEACLQLRSGEYQHSFLTAKKVV
jgi:hypothetical protein